jgi:hypothetical protein
MAPLTRRSFVGLLAAAGTGLGSIRQKARPCLDNMQKRLAGMRRSLDYMRPLMNAR